MLTPKIFELLSFESVSFPGRTISSTAHQSRGKGLSDPCFRTAAGVRSGQKSAKKTLVQTVNSSA